MNPSPSLRRLGVVDKYPTHTGGMAARGQWWLLHTLDVNNLFELLRRRIQAQDRLKTAPRPRPDRFKTDPLNKLFF